MIRMYAMIVGVAVLVVAALVMGRAVYRNVYNAGAKQERLVCDAEWAPRVDALTKEKIAAQHAVIAAQQARAAAEASLAAQLEEQAHEHSKREAALRAGRDGLQRELARLRDALATARIGLRSLAESKTAGTGHAPDGGAADTGQLLGACAERLVEVGGSADRLAAQVIGLQAYARLAQRACGS